MLKLTDNPPMTLPGFMASDDDSQQWAIAYCKSRQVKSLAWDLCRFQVHYFLPMVLRETFSGGRRRRNMYPIFESYLFFAGSKEERLAILDTKQVVQVFDINLNDQPTFRRDIYFLELALRRAPEKNELYPQLVDGKRARITGAGPHAGIEGVILTTGKQTELWIGIAFMNAGIIIEIDADLIESHDDKT